MFISKKLGTNNCLSYRYIGTYRMVEQNNNNINLC
ncbi:MAG: hypothetical protein K0R06_549 [Clostridium sp.]|nr:hypothetical protein [Clostridium sp.]